MNFKQKLGYMCIGCLFTLAGYFLASLANTNPPNAHAQENKTEIIDEIVCKKIRIVNDTGTTIAELKKNNLGGGWLVINDRGSKKVAVFGANLLGGGLLAIRNEEGKRVVSLSTYGGGILSIRTKKAQTLQS